MRRRDDNSTSRTGRLEGKSPPPKKSLQIPQMGKNVIIPI